MNHADVTVAFLFLYELHRLALGPYIEQTWGWDENWQRDHFDRAFPDISSLALPLRPSPCTRLPR
jgi:hypothetical protein